MDFSRCVAAVVCLLVLSVGARANLFRVHISTRTYTLNNKGEVIVRVGNQREFIDLAAQNSSSDTKSLVLVYDTAADALEVVRKDDGSHVLTVMSFIDSTQAVNVRKTMAYRQAFLSLSGSAVVTGTATVSGTTPVAGSVAGPVHIDFDPADNIAAYRWNADFQYSIPSNPTTLNRVVLGHFILGRELRAKATP